MAVKSCGKPWFTWNALGAVKQLHQLAFRAFRTMNFCSSLMMLWQELELSARKICLPEPHSRSR